MSQSYVMPDFSQPNFNTLLVPADSPVMQSLRQKAGDDPARWAEIERLVMTSAKAATAQRMASAVAGQSGADRTTLSALASNGTEADDAYEQEQLRTDQEGAMAILNNTLTGEGRDASVIAAGMKYSNDLLKLRTESLAGLIQQNNEGAVASPDGTMRELRAREEAAFTTLQQANSGPGNIPLQPKKPNVPGVSTPGM